MIWAVLLAFFQLFGVVFYYVQRSGKTVGGAISLVKSFWLTYAITHWVLGPFVYAALAPDPVLRGAWWVLGSSMALRSIIELILCYGTLTWKTEYGIAHDAFQAGLCVFFLYLLCLPPETDWIHAALVLLTIVSLGCEVGFVATFRKATGGPALGVYFVPGHETRINRITLTLLLPQYAALAFLLWLLVQQ